MINKIKEKHLKKKELKQKVKQLKEAGLDVKILSPNKKLKEGYILGLMKDREEVKEVKEIKEIRGSNHDKSEG